MRRAAGGLAARLMFAGWNRRRALRRELPHTDRGGSWRGHSRDGDRFCSGGGPAHHGGLAHAQPGLSSESVVVISGGGHLGPHEAGELSGDGGDDDFAVRLALVEAAELAAQAQLGGPRPGHHLGVEALLAALEDSAGGGAGLVGLGRLHQLGAQVGVAGVGDAAPLGALPAGVLRGHQAAEAP